jgi:hypothetical protein
MGGSDTPEHVAWPTCGEGGHEERCYCGVVNVRVALQCLASALSEARWACVGMSESKEPQGVASLPEKLIFCGRDNLSSTWISDVGVISCSETRSNDVRGWMV